MAITNHERVGKAMDYLKEGLYPFIERELVNTFKDRANSVASQYVADDRINAARTMGEWDSAVLLRVMWEGWNSVFREVLGFAERSLISELRDTRNRWAHQENFSSDDTYRALDSTHRLLTAVSAPQASEVEKLKNELLRVRFDEQNRQERRRSAATAQTLPMEIQTSGTLRPWREVINPHQDVSSGRFQQAEFAADLWQVHLGEGTDEYRDPIEFFRRTYLTESLDRLLVGAVQRLAGNGGDPVVQLQTNFGGGKTHSMLALYHLFSGASVREMAGIDGVLEKAGVTDLPTVTPVVLVGNKISPGNPVTKPDGTEVRTLWGELAWQLGGRPAYDRIRADDERATNPGDVLRELFNEYGPCLVLIDEWVAYARQLHEQSDLPAGSFETQFSFAQALTESARLADHCMLVISLPASDSATSSNPTPDDTEVGGMRGREALERLHNVIGRLDSPWRPATAEESFEIVRRRLFEPLVEQSKFVSRDAVARTFYDFYRSQKQEFPPECSEPAYENRLRDAYPIHPEVFDRLYTDWSTLLSFQRTRGVLRLMAAVIHCLWDRGDRQPLIMPSSISMDDPRVQFEFTRYLPENWAPVIEGDVDGPNSLALRIDNDVPNLGKFGASRRVARTIFLGSAPINSAANQGLEDRRVKLGCVMPEESPAIFSDALRRLAGTATYLYQDGPRYWYSTQATVTKVADDRAEQYRRNNDAVTQEISQRLRQDLRNQGEFSRVHPLPQSAQDVADDPSAGLVVLSTEHPYSREENSAALVEARSILESRGSSPRINQNSLVFLAPDQTRLQDLEDAVRRFLAWKSVLDDKNILNLSPHQVRQAETQLESVNGAVTARLPETYHWLLVPTQGNPQESVQWQGFRLTGQDALAVRASKKLLNDELLVTNYAGTLLRMELDKIPLWRGDHVPVRQLVEDFARYIYLPRLKDPSVLLDAIRSGLALLTWQQDSFAYADSYDETAQRYVGVRFGEQFMVGDSTSSALVVRPEIARRQINAEVPPEVPPIPNPPPVYNPGPPTQPKRFHGTVSLNPARAGRDASRIADEVIAHLAGLMGGTVKVTLEIEAEIPDGAPEQVVRVVTENSRTLNFTSQGFEAE